MSHTELRLPSKCFWGGGPLEGLRQLVELRPTRVRNMDGGILNPRISWTVFRWEGAGGEGRGRLQREQSGERGSGQGKSSGVWEARWDEHMGSRVSSRMRPGREGTGSEGEGLGSHAQEAALYPQGLKAQTEQ